jgi:hypothetical protein
MSVGRAAGWRQGHGRGPIACRRMVGDTYCWDVGGLQLGSPDSEVAVVFHGPERPHDDPLTWFKVEMRGPGMHSIHTVESLSGDAGFIAPAISVEGGKAPTHRVATRLSDFLLELSATEHPWHGERSWRSLEGDLELSAMCDALGHVTITVTLAPRPWQPTWRSSATITHALGDLKTLSDAVRTWFDT